MDQPIGAAAIHDTLARRFGPDRVFRDCVSMLPGQDYPAELREALERVDILVSVIGPEWMTLTDENTGQRLIDRERDWVRGEIARALQRGIEVVPVLLKDTPADAKPLDPDTLPPEIQALGLKQAAEVSQRHFGEDLDRLVARLIHLAPTLVITELFTRQPTPRTAENAPSTLLLPEYEIVPFAGRTEELTDLLSWATGPEACSAKLVVGPAGSGKTRLAQRLCTELVAQGWLAGTVNVQASAAQIRNTSGIDRPLLVIVDDAEVRSNQLTALAAALGERSVVRDAPARLLLFSSSNGDWLTKLQAHHDNRVAELFRQVAEPSTMTLSACPPDRYGQFLTARAAFARELGLAEMMPTETPTSLDHCESTLDIHAAALGNILVGGAESVPRHPLDRLLHSDRRHWRRLALANGRSDMKTQSLATVSTVATLCRPASEEASTALLTRLPALLRDDAYPADEYAAWLRRLYPGPHPLNPLHPDALGHKVVAATLAAQPSIPVTLAATCTEEQIANALTVLGRALPHHPQLESAIVDLVRVAPKRLVMIGVDVAARLPEPELFSRALGTAIGDSAFAPDDAVALLLRLQKGSHRLDPLLAALIRTSPTFFKQITEAIHRRNGASESPATKRLTEMIDRLNDMALDVFTGFLDPGSRRFPTAPDGREIIPPIMFQLAQTLRIARDWLPRDSKE